VTDTVAFSTTESWSPSARFTSTGDTDVLIFPGEQEKCVFAITSTDALPGIPVANGAPVFLAGREMRLVNGDRLWLASPHGDQTVTMIYGDPG
jgi:hypothetical protein